MIVFDLDGTLADCEHRRHFVTHKKHLLYSAQDPSEEFPALPEWKPDWDAFYEACDKDMPIQPTINLYNIFKERFHVQIWSGRSTRVRRKTKEWLKRHGILCRDLKMRPNGNAERDDALKERWLDEALAKGKKIDFVIDDRKKVIDMWLRRGIFVFDVGQGKGDF